MSIHQAQIKWTSQNSDFSYENFSRSHTIKFKKDALNGTGSTEFPGNPEGTNPEEMLLAALLSCHMMTFLAIASKKRLPVLQYEDEGTVFLEKNNDGMLAVTKVILKPKVQFSGPQIPNSSDISSIHEKAHKYCVIANSIKAHIEIQPQ